MALLRVLGTVDIDGGPGDENARALLAKPKLTALTVYLLLAHRNGWCRRDELAALFWPESDQAHARSSLSQALYQVRQHLGPESLAIRGAEDVRLTPDALSCDALQLRQAVAEGDDRWACGLYAGEFMPAFHMPDAPEFHHWLEGVRESLRSQALQSAWKAAEEGERAADLAGAAECFRVAGVLSALDSVGIARSMAGLARVNAHVDALELFDRYGAARRSELGVEPDATLSDLADDIRRAGLGRVPDINAPSVPGEVASRVEGGPPRPVERAPWQKGALLLVLAAVLIAVVAQLPSVRPRVTPDPSRLLILPFTEEGTATGEDRTWLTTTLPISLRPLLDGAGGLTAVSESQATRVFTAHGLNEGGELSAANVSQVAEAVGAGYYLTGRVLHDAGRRRLHAELVETETGEARVVVRLPIDSLDTFTVAHRLAGEILIGLLGEESRSPQLLSQSLDALREYVDGWVARRDARYLDAIRHYQAAMRIDSTFALAALAYRESAMWLPDGTPHRLALLRADSILARWPDRLSTADQALAAAMLATYRNNEDGPAVLTTLREATLRAPDRASAWLLLGDFLLHDGRMLGIPNSITLGGAALDSAERLDSALPEPRRHLVEIRFAQHDTAFARRYLTEHPPDTTAFDHLAWVAAELLGDPIAMETFGQILPTGPTRTWLWMLLWSARAGAGFTQADSAAVLLSANPSLDDVSRGEERFVLAHYRINRGWPVNAENTVATNAHYPARRHQALGRLELGLPLPSTWVDLSALAQQVMATLGGLDPMDHLWADCHLGAWHALNGRARLADSLANELSRWNEDPGLRRGPIARTCPHVIRALHDSTPDFRALRLADSLLLSEPAATLRIDLTRWNLLLARAYRDRGRPDLGLPLTTRLGFIVESSAYQTPALLLEGELSLATGDTARAARAYALAAAFLSAPAPALAASADSVAALSRELAKSACGGDCGPYQW